MKTPDENIKQSGTNKGYRSYIAQYENLKKATGFGAEHKAQKALNTANEYYETYRNEITILKNAEQHLKGVLQKHFDAKKPPPITKWKAEIAKLTVEQKRLDNSYIALKNEVKEAERIRKSVYSIIMKVDACEKRLLRSRNIEI